MDEREQSMETAGGRSVLICLVEARDLLLRLCGAPPEMVDVRTADGRRAFVASVATSDARRFMGDPRSSGLVLRREA